MYNCKHILSYSNYIRLCNIYNIQNEYNKCLPFILRIRNFHTNTNVFENYYSWSDPNGPMKVLHDYNKVRIPFIIKSRLIQTTNRKDEYLKYLKGKQSGSNSKILQGLNIFEVGCGGGILSEELARLGAHVLGIDTSTTAIEYANKRLERLNSESQEKLDIEYMCCDLKDFSYDKKFSIIICSEVLEHMSFEDKELFFSLSNKLLSQDGTLIVTTPSKTLFSLVTNIILAENIFQIVPKGTHSFSMFISYNELIDLANKYGFNEFDSAGVLYIPFCRKFVVVDSKMQLYMASFIK